MTRPNRRNRRKSRMPPRVGIAKNLRYQGFTRNYQRRRDAWRWTITEE